MEKKHLWFFAGKNTNFIKFFGNMKKILDEKQKEQQDLWKTCDIYHLKDKLFSQYVRLNFSDKEKAKKKLIHIANYCYFLYTRLGDNNGN